MSITIQDGVDALTDVVKNVGNISTAQHLRAANYIDELFYSERTGIEPETLLTTLTFQIETGVRDYTLPTTFLNFSDKGGVYRTNANSDLLYLEYDGGTVLFVVDEVVTSSTGAFGTIVEITGNATSGNLVLALVDTDAGSFTDNGVLTGSIAGVAVQNGSSESFGETEKQYTTGSHGIGGSDLTYTIKKSGSTNTLHFNQFPTQDVLAQLVFIPKRTVFTTEALTENYSVEDRHKEHILDALLVWYGIFDKNPTMEGLSNNRFSSILADYRDKLPVSTEGFNEPDDSSDF